MAQLAEAKFTKPQLAIKEFGYPRGRGVVAKTRFEKGDLIERVPVIILPPAERPNVDATALTNYYFSWQKDWSEVAIALGYGSLYNHSFEPNAQYFKKFSEKCIEFVALRRIEFNEEIVVNYNEDPNDKTPLWFPTV